MLKGNKIIVLIILAGVAYIMFDLLSGYTEKDQLSEVAQYYAAPENIKSVNAQNLVTAIVVTYRGLDTLGEVTILFLTAAIIGFFLKQNGTGRTTRETSEILKTASTILLPVITLLGIYVFVNGHLTPGGGFQGGAIIASGIALMLLASPTMEFRFSPFTILESISGLVFIGLGLLGIVLAGGFLDNRIMAMGKFGTLLSAGAIPIIYIFVGLKVGSELSNILGKLQSSQKN